MSARRQRPRNTLGLSAEDADGLIDAVERSFGVKFDTPIHWRTVGDMHAALLECIPAGTEAGLCATSMAFYRVRRALRAVLGKNRLIRPDTRLSHLTRRPARFVLKAVAAELGLPVPNLGLSWLGGIGLLMMLCGFFLGVGSVFFHRLWPTWLLLPLGFVLVRFDPCTFGSQTVGSLARSFAFQNFGAFVHDGADHRPERIWESLTDLLGELMEDNPSLINPETLLLAQEPMPVFSLSRPFGI